MKQSDILEDWKHRTCVIATMHAKEKVISPILSEKLGVCTSVPTEFNTDCFGTFTREIKRVGNQIETARKKALAVMEHSGSDFALASEGSFGSHPSTPFLSSNLEIVLLIDKKNGIEIAGYHRTGDVKFFSQEIITVDDALSVAEKWGFPDQGVIVRLSEKSNRNIQKEIITVEELKIISKKFLSGRFTKSIFLETDMRAHRCPKRMESIRKATFDLVKNCLNLCPQCSTPGFVVTDIIKGLPCSSCGEPTELAMELVYSCQKCSHGESKPVDGDATASPGQCERCNP
jgi:hypothetical protein